MIRKAKYAHSWYAGNPDSLRSDLASYMEEPHASHKVAGLMAPHAGYMYSGPVAGAVYSRVHVPDTVVVIAVNHRGMGARAAIMSSGAWETPLGTVQIDEGCAQRLIEHIPMLEEDHQAHSMEHSLELHLPFLQYRNAGFQLVPICLQKLDYAECEALGTGLARAVGECPGDVLLVASTDMTHFESQEAAKKKDHLAIQRVLEVDPEGLYNTVEEKRISMCGYIPTTSLLCACRSLGVKKGELVRYATSGDVSGDYGSVVGYAGVLLP